MGSILTNVGRTKLASATPEDQLTVLHIAVGDGAGGYPPLLPTMTALTNEVWRGTASQPIRGYNDETIIFEGYIPADIGGFFIREVAIFDDTGAMIAIGNTSLVEKPDPVSGSSISLSVRLHVTLDSTSDVELIFQDQPTIDHGGLSGKSNPHQHPAASIDVDALPALSQPISDLQTILELLKTAATKEAQTSAVDTTIERLMQVGAFGLGKPAIISGNWNAITATGFYTNLNTAQSELPNASAALSLLHIEVGTGGNAAQICMRTASATPQTWRRSKQASTWGPWVEQISDIYVEISNANNAIKSGFYSLPASLGATNSPVAGSSGSILVINGGAGSSYITQVWTQANETDENRMFIRHKKLSAWSPWNEIYHNGNNEQVGSVSYFITTVAPAGYIQANGAAISRTAYAALFAKIGTFWGVGNGSTTFNIPDLRGEFIRGWDDGRGVDPAAGGRAFGSLQTDDFKSHSHTLSTRLGANTGNGSADNSDLTGTPYSATTSSSGGAETRPRNVALVAYIKY